MYLACQIGLRSQRTQAAGKTEVPVMGVLLSPLKQWYECCSSKRLICLIGQDCPEFGTLAAQATAMSQKDCQALMASLQMQIVKVVSA